MFQDAAKGWATENIVCSRPDDVQEQLILRDSATDGMDVAFTYDVKWEVRRPMGRGRVYGDVCVYVIFAGGTIAGAFCENTPAVFV